MAEGESIVSFVPLTEGCSINDNNSVLHQGLGTDQLVVGSVVDNVNDTGLPGNGNLRILHDF